MLDTGPLGDLTRRGRNPNHRFRTWVLEEALRGRVFLLPEIADYELRRNLMLEDLQDSLNRLDRLKKTLGYVPITTAVMLQAAAFWAQVRKAGKPTADPHALDADVILAAQAMAAKATVLTYNKKHLSRFVHASTPAEIMAP